MLEEPMDFFFFSFFFFSDFAFLQTRIKVSKWGDHRQPKVVPGACGENCLTNESINDFEGSSIIYLSISIYFKGKR